MKKTTLLFVLLLFVVAVPLHAQMPPPPKPLNDDLCAWMVGEWEGWTTSPMGKMKDWAKYEWGLDKQFVLSQYTGQMAAMTADQKKKAVEMSGMSMEDFDKMMKMGYKGRGPITINPSTGDFMGYWFDNMRGIYKGTGKRDGNKLTMTWEGGAMGTEVRTTEKISDDKMVVTFKSTDPKGNVSEGKSELTRKKAAK